MLEILVLLRELQLELYGGVGSWRPRKNIFFVKFLPANIYFCATRGAIICFEQTTRAIFFSFSNHFLYWNDGIQNIYFWQWWACNIFFEGNNLQNIFFFKFCSQNIYLRKLPTPPHKVLMVALRYTCVRMQFPAWIKLKIATCWRARTSTLIIQVDFLMI